MAMTLRLTDEEQAVLQAQAEREGVSMQEVVKRAIVQRATHWQHTHRVAESADRMLVRWADVLDDLANA
ncbi:MAG: CopG family transcriptional regulator [Egibacteraceae bacterium]